MRKKNPKAGEDFTELTVKLLIDTTALCEETFAAADDVPPLAELLSLIERADAHVAYYHGLLEQYSGGRLESLRAAGRDIVQLVKFTAALRPLTTKPT